MPLLLYRLVIAAYVGAIRIAAMFGGKARLFIEGRKHWRIRLKQQISSYGEKRCIWFHCASLGEFEQGRPLLERMREQHPNHLFVLTFFSPSGFEIRKNHEGAEVVSYLPVDSASNASDFIDIIRPDMAFFVKYDYWYYYLATLKRKGIPIFLVSAIFRDSQPFFKWYGNLHRQMLRYVTCFFVQNEASKHLLNHIGIDHVAVTGDTRYDRVIRASEQNEPIEKIEKWRIGYKILVAGSTWVQDEKLLCQLNEFQNGQLKLIVVPHEISDSGIGSTLERFGPHSMAFSKWNSLQEGVNCLVVDSIGLLMRLYRYADLAYVGGGFGAGIHNTLEAAVYGPPIIFGPNHERFQEAVQLKDAGGAFVVEDTLALQKTVSALLNDPAKLQSIRESNSRLMHQHAGATQRILDSLKNFERSNN